MRLLSTILAVIGRSSIRFVFVVNLVVGILIEGGLMIIEDLLARMDLRSSFLEYNRLNHDEFLSRCKVRRTMSIA